MKDVTFEELAAMRREAEAHLDKRRRTSVAKEIRRAEKAGKHVTSITTPDGHTLHFGAVQNAQIAQTENLTPDDELAQWRKKRAR